jgi:uncharacterized membrane protein
MTALHILAGALALLAGATAMLAAKGGNAHRRAGLLFVATMLVMGSSGAWMAAIKPVRISVVAGLLVVYLVSTSWLTVRADINTSRRARLALMALTGLGLLVAALGVYYASLAWLQPTRRLDAYPAPIYLAFGGLAAVGALLDMRLLRAGCIAGKHRLARHLWRMELAMYLATSAFFLGQAKLFPESVRQHTALLAAPVLLVVIHLVYWLWKTLRLRPSVPSAPAISAPSGRQKT